MIIDSYSLSSQQPVLKRILNFHEFFNSSDCFKRKKTITNQQARSETCYNSEMPLGFQIRVGKQ